MQNHQLGKETSSPIILPDSDDEPEPMDIGSETNQAAEANSNADKTDPLEVRMRRALERSDPWKCSICANKFRSLQSLQNHVKENHKEYAYFCKHCPYFTKYRNSDIRRHVRTHQEMECKYKNRGGYKCELCNVWSNKNYFSRHLLLYHGE